MLCGVLPVLLLSRATAEYQPAWAVQLLCVVDLGDRRRGLTLTTDRLRPMQMCFWVFSYIWLGLAPAGHAHAGHLPVAAAGDARTWRCGPASSCCSACWRTARRPSSLGERAGATTPRRSRPARVGRSAPTRALLLGVVSWPIARRAGAAAGWRRPFLRSRQAATPPPPSPPAAPGGAQAALAGWGLSVPAFWALLALLFARFPRGGWQWRARWLLLPPVIALNLLVNNPISQPRYWAGTVLIALVLCSRPLASVRAFRALALAAARRRRGGVPARRLLPLQRPEHPQVSVTTQLVTNPDYDAYQQIQGGVVLVRDTGHHPVVGRRPAGVLGAARGLAEQAAGRGTADRRAPRLRVHQPVLAAVDRELHLGWVRLGRL